MEMQQAQLFAARSPRTGIGCHLKLVQPTGSARYFKSASSVETRQEARSVERRPSERGGLRGIAPEHVERFLNHLRGEALLVGALSYDLGLKLSQLRFLRIRDVNLTARVIELSDGAKPIPTALYDELRDHISEKLCSRRGAQGGQKRNQLLFGHEAFEDVLKACARTFADARLEANSDDASAVTISRLRPSRGNSLADSGVEVSQRVRDNFLRVMGWFLTKRVSKRGGRIQSPLGLFDKGPKIVRRDRGGVVQSYYLWRAVYSR